MVKILRFNTCGYYQILPPFLSVKLPFNTYAAEGYRLLFTFLEGYYALQDQKDEFLFANLLGDMDILDDGITADPAAWFDWIDSIAKVNSIINMQISATGSEADWDNPMLKN
jgi:hypothetical protein